MIKSFNTYINKSLRIVNFEPIAQYSFGTGKGKNKSNGKFVSSGPIVNEIKQEAYEHQVNYNFEHYQKFTKKFEEAKAIAQHDNDLQLSIEKGDTKIVPRRKRRIYDKPRIDRDISNYSAWRSLQSMIKPNQHAFPIVCKILLPPAKLIKKFGSLASPTRNMYATREYDFQDVNMDQFLLYDYRQTTEYWGPNDEDYDYENQEHIRLRRRKYRWPTVDEFWASEELYPFRLNCTRYADHFKFKEWITRELDQVKESDQDYDDYIRNKYADKFYLHNDYSKEHELTQEVPVFKYNRAWYLEKGESLKYQSRFNDPIKPREQLKDEHLIGIGDEQSQQ